jgi:kynurenine formamidase
MSPATVNLIEAVASLKVYDLGRPLEPATPIAPVHVPFRMGLMRRHDTVRADGSSSANELITLSGHTGTHVDALCHFSMDGRLHGGAGALEASKGGGFSQLGVHTVAPFVCRGLLLDVPRALGQESLEAGQPITAAEMEAACRHHGTEVGPGDAVLVRTGWPVGRYHDPQAYLGLASGVPGPDLSAARWLSGRGVRVTGTDTIAYEWQAPGTALTSLPVHVHTLVESGIHLIEVMDLEAAAADGVREFLFVCVPLRIVGATGSPVRPLALVQP